MEIFTNWAAVRDYLRRRPVAHTTVIAGTREWAELDDNAPEKLAALVVAGSRWVLERELDQLDRGRHALKQAALDIAAAKAWNQVAQQIRDRDDYYRSNPDLRRRVS